jgi:hypothetical protein
MEKRYHIEDILGSKGRFKILKALALGDQKNSLINREN